MSEVFMKNEGVVDIVIRSKRQMTLPREFCNRLGISPGDMLEMAVEGNRLVATPKKTLAVDAVHEIREAFRRSGISEKELLDSGRKIRKEIAKERHAKKA
jgi:bifunctional DNA-binding transcriptional regulator/antitoxin component of YhaV-PrlF toxin-antitoxin module